MREGFICIYTFLRDFILQQFQARDKSRNVVYITYTRTVWKVRGLVLLLRVGTLWRCGDGLFFEVPTLASDALHTTLHPLLENVPQTVGHFEISCVGAPFSQLKNTRNRMGWGLVYMSDVLMGFHRSTFQSRTQNSIQISPHAIYRLYQPRKGSSEVRNFEVINGLQHVFEKWVESCKKCIACQGRYFEKETVTAPPQSSDSE
jgi:hypothetical protein